MKKMLKKFPFGDSLLKVFGVLQLLIKHSVNTVLGLAKRFLELSDNESLDTVEGGSREFSRRSRELISI